MTSRNIMSQILGFAAANSVQLKKNPMGIFDFEDQNEYSVGQLDAFWFMLIRKLATQKIFFKIIFINEVTPKLKEVTAELTNKTTGGGIIKLTFASGQQSLLTPPMCHRIKRVMIQSMMRPAGICPIKYERQTS